MEKKISVVVATYNGEKYLKEQLESITCQLNDGDELLISDDGSKDKTIDLIKEYEKEYKQIKFYNGPGKGYVANFEFLIKKAKNDIILISDQDDIWNSEKIGFIKKIFAENPDIWVVLHNALYINEKGEQIGGTLFESRNTQKGFWHNWMKSGYYGCCMAIRKDYGKRVMPLPEHFVSYDQCIGLYAELFHKTVITNELLIKHRIHNANQSQKRNIPYRIAVRFLLLEFIVRKVFVNRKYNRMKKENIKQEKNI